MGNNISNFTDIAAIGSYVSELQDVHFEKNLGKARFMKTLRGKHSDGYVVIKLYIKPESGKNLAKQVQKIQEEHTALKDVPNAFYFQRVMETDRASYLVRPYLYSSLYDRISIRPFLTTIEKKWIAYQLLRGIADSHARNVCHGDIKTENVLVTSWNWAFLVDYAFYKPTYLPENNPADFSFFFDTSYRRTCYIAPERFYRSGTEIDARMTQNDYTSELTPAMDIFSAGCVIAELFLEGKPPFTLPQLFKYRSGEYSPNASLDQIEDVEIRKLVKHMIQIDPEQRLSAEEYLAQWHGKAFPHYFYSFLYQYMSTLVEKFQHQPPPQPQSKIMSEISSAYPNANSRKLADADGKIERMFYDFEKIMYFISFPCQDVDHADGRKKKNDSVTASSILLPPTSNIPNYAAERLSPEENPTPSLHSPDEEGSLILLSYVSSLLRNTLYPSSKLKAMDVLLALAERLPDDVKLDRLVPYLVELLKDSATLVRANAIKTLTKVLCMVESISPINARIFPEYILPSIEPFARDEDVLVRLTYASCIALLAETALRFLEMTQLLKADNIYPHRQDIDSEDLDFESAYDTLLKDLHTTIQNQTSILLADPESSVKRALLTNITCLAFFESVKGVGTFVGSRSLETYILPLMVQSLADAEEFVVENVLNSLTSLSDLGLFQKMKLWELISIIWPLTCHPNAWIRHAAVGFISSSVKHLAKTDVWCIVYPMIRPFLRTDIADINEQTLLENMEPPISRQVYEQAMVWAAKATVQSTFWKRQIAKPAKEHSSTKTARVPSRPSENLLQGNDDQNDLSHEYVEGVFYRNSYETYCCCRPKADNDTSVNKGDIQLKNLNVTPNTAFLPDLSGKRTSQIKQQQMAAAKKLVPTDKQVQAPPIASLRTGPREDLCKLSRIASQPHVRAISPGIVDKENYHHYERSSSIPIQGHHRTLHSPIPSPSDHHFGTSLPKSLERPKSIILTMDAIKSKNGKGEPLELNVLSQGQHSNPPPPAIDTTAENGDKPSAPLEVSSIGYAHLQRLFDKTAMEAFPALITEFSQDVKLSSRLKKLTAMSPLVVSNKWKPEGNLVAHYTEHTAAINQLDISFDRLLFASCSDDGSVRIWDCSRLERNVTNRSRASYTQQGGRIKCLTFIQDTHSIAAASDNGSIHVFRANIQNASIPLKFGKCIPLREYQLVDEYAVLLQHFTSNASNTMKGAKSILMFATTQCCIYALDLLTMDIVWKLQNPKSHGVITSMVTGPRHTWLLVGTMRGILTLYDLRFQIPLKSWLHPSKSRISALVLVADSRDPGRHLVRIASGRNEISTWDIEHLTCLEVFAVKTGDEKTTGVFVEAYKALEVPADKAILSSAFTNNESNLVENSIRAIVSPADSHFIITAGTDRKIRFWDTLRIENSGVVLGLDIDEPKPRYSTNIYDKMKVHFEFTLANRNQNMSNVGSRTSFSTNQSASNNVITQQHYLMRNHTDAITDVIITEAPYSMIISGDRDGVIKIVS
ncbi:hypothetical protein [Parasitella parasitica]|uniref:non-specific serine/threonine protein kinase n=1 Tax=Parasitella parasitica TaxID=35722 RepID=A0A0B7N8K6_9FUNG|nr:hypothetical protein [Parasitella parasitica]